MLPKRWLADLPELRLQPCPPFTYVGIDCFRPWNIVTRPTRGGSLNSNLWAVIFVCMSSRAVHFEVVEEMNTDSLINAKRPFIVFRGPVKQLYSDRGTNFVGAANKLGLKAVFAEDNVLNHSLNYQDILWNFNTPYSSHVGGSLERLIGICRHILDNILFDSRHYKLMKF